MNFWLKYDNANLEKHYQTHYNLKIFKQSRLLLLLMICYAFINFITTLVDYFISDVQEYHQNEWLISKLVTIIICCILIGSLFIINKNFSTSSPKKINILMFLISIALQIGFSNIIWEKEPNFNEIRYGLFWEAYEIQFYTLVISMLFKNWIIKITHFCCSCMIFGIAKANNSFERISNMKVILLIITFTIVIYTFEKLNRDYFSEIHDLLEKERVWKRLLDHLPEDIIIIDNYNNVKYKNATLFRKNYKDSEKAAVLEKLDSADFSQQNNEFVSKVTNLLLRDSAEDLRLKYCKSYSYDDNPSLMSEKLISFQKTSAQKRLSVAKDSKTSPIINKLKKRPRTLKEVLELVKNSINSLLSSDLYLTFDGIYNGKTVEIRMISTIFEGKACIMMIVYDTTQRNIISKLEQNDKFKNVVLSTVSHELRNPLNSSISMLQIASEDSSVPVKVRKELLDPCLRSLGMLTNLINDILDYSQIKENKLKLVFQYTDLRQLAYDACSLVETQCQKKGLKLRLNIDPDIPDTFVTDPNRLTQILLNLLSNALKFTPQGFIKVIMKWKDKDQGLIFISVQDSGIGIKDEDISKLFKEYSKLDLGKNSSINPTGCGLGLNISQKLAKCLSQENEENPGIHVESEVNKGTTFSFIIHDKIIVYEISQNLQSSVKFESQLNEKSNHNIDTIKNNLKVSPVQEANNAKISFDKFQKFKTIIKKDEDFQFSITDEGEKPNANKYAVNDIKEFILLGKHKKDEESVILLSKEVTFHQLLTEEKPFVPFMNKKLKILIVDDDEFNLYSARLNLQTLDVQFETANSGEKAIKLVELWNNNNNPFNIILMDCHMPIMNGFETTQILKEKMRKNEIQFVPIIACTGASDEETKQKCRDAGMDDVIEKSMARNKIIELISANKN